MKTKKNVKATQKATQKAKKTRSSSLKKKISKYFCATKEQDICCEGDYNREEIAREIIKMYKGNLTTESLESLDNDIYFFIGFRIDLVEANNKEGVKIWDLIGNQTKKFTEITVKKLLMDLPLYYLLAFLGRTYMKFKKD